MQNIHHVFYAIKIVLLAITRMEFRAINVVNKDGFLKMGLAMKNVHKEVLI